jgi:hypothetical protein
MNKLMQVALIRHSAQGKACPPQGAGNSHQGNSSSTSSTSFNTSNACLLSSSKLRMPYLQHIWNRRSTWCLCSTTHSLNTYPQHPCSHLM